uniref:Coiled-coil SMC6 And NSE5 INteracting (CANIN) domain-containing protein n=1 Tax=Anolis carolinensis TaxID=28377 RepID=G1KCE5_ANOCA
MTQYLSGSAGGGANGGDPDSSSLSTAGRHCRTVGREGKAGRNQCITDYFKLTVKQDRNVLSSPEKRNGKDGLEVARTEQLRQNMCSPKQNRRKKFQPPPPNRSPIIEALFRGAKSEKKDNPDVSTKTVHSNTVVRKLFVLNDSCDQSLMLRDNTCTENPETQICPIRTRSPLADNGRECKKDYVGLELIGSELNKSISENDSLKKSGTSWCQQTVFSKATQPGSISSSSRLSVETLCREIQVKEKKVLSTQQSFDSVKKSLGSNFPNQDTRDILRERSCFTSQESYSEKRNGKGGLSVASTEHLRRHMCTPKQKRRKLLSSPSNRSPKIETLFRGAKSEKRGHPDNGVHISTKPVHRNTVDTRDILRDRSCFSSQKSSSDESLSTHVSKAVLCSRRTSDKITNREKSQSCPSVYINSTNVSISKHKEFPEKQKRRSLKSSLKKLEKPMRQNYSVSSSLEKHKSNYSQHRIYSDDAALEGMKSFDNNLPFLVGCCEKGGDRNCLTDKNGQIQIGDAKKAHKNYVSYTFDNSPLLSTSYHNSLKGKAEQTENNTSALSSENTNQLVSSLEGGNSVPLSESCQPVTTNESSYNLHKLNIEASSLKAGAPSRKRSVSNSEKEITDCNLDSSDEEILPPLEKILAQGFTCGKSPEQIYDEDNTTDTLILSHSVTCSTPSVETNVSYLNRLLEEKEEFSRIEELEQQLQQVKGDTEKNYLLKEQSNDVELLAEHREILEKYSIVDGIPDQHPGENIFQVAHAGKIFNQHNLDLRNFGFHPQNPIEKYIFRSGITQQLFVISEGILVSAYHTSPCPVPMIKWMFQMMLVHSDCSVSRKILQTLMALTIRNASFGSEEPAIWIPSLFDIAVVLINLGIPFNELFPLRDFQPSFTEDHIRSEIPETVTQQSRGDIFGDPFPFFFLVDVNLCNMAKFLQLCISICNDGYTQKEIFILLLLLFKLSLEKQMKQFALVDLQCLIVKLLESIEKWKTKMPELCLAISCLSSHHHNLLHLIQFVPNWTERGREVRRHLSLVVLSKLLENHVNIPSSHDQQMSLLCKELVMMKPSNLVKKLLATSAAADAELSNASFISKFEPKAYYLVYVLLHLVREASNFESTNLSQKKWLLKLSSILEKNIKCDIRENARLFYKTKVKDLVARTYSKWQQMINSSQLIQGMIHDFVVPNAEQDEKLERG